MEHFGRYQLLRRIGVGGMAEVFLARSAGIDGFEKELVIKRIRPEYSAYETFSSRFIDEARISISLSHQNIAQVFDFGEIDGLYYLAMEYIQGCDLEVLMSAAGPALAPPVALFIMSEACRALDYVHQKRGRRDEELHLVHRDISPQNIMVSFAGGVKVMDFGIAQARGRSVHTAPGLVFGKLAYMAPEQAAGDPVDERADIYACGLVLWEMLCGTPVFSGEMDPESLRRIREAEISPPSAKNKKLSSRLDKLVMRALAPNPEDRFASAREFGNQIHLILSHKYPEFTPYSLQGLLDDHRRDIVKTTLELLEAEDLERSAVVMQAMAPPPVLTLPQRPPASFEWSPELIAAVEAFRAQPSLWLLMNMGAACAKGGSTQAALSAYRAAAVKFGQRGLLAQCLLCCRRMRELAPFVELRPLISRMPALSGCASAALEPYLYGSDGPFEQLLKELLAETNPAGGVVGGGTPLLRYIEGEAFAELAAQAPLTLFEPEAHIIEQETSGRTMYLIARGRALIYANTSAGERVYLSSLMAGDFFGENAFYTGAPRSATVEALEQVEAFEINHELCGRLLCTTPEASAILLKFYKERIVDVVLAKSPTFGLLPIEDRRRVIDKFDLVCFEAGQTILREGELSDEIYLVKEGTAEVFTEQDGSRTVLATLGPCTLFGEVAALQRVPRTASVRAQSKIELLRLERSEFQEILDDKPELRRKILDVRAERVRENLDRLTSFRVAR